MKHASPAPCLAALALLAAVPASALTPVGARNGMVVTSSAPATDVGVEILRRGGNAVDAAVAVGFALAVTHPTAGNLGGGGFMLVRMADGRTVALDYRETAPAVATRDMYLDARGTVIPKASTRGPRSAGVPGTVAGLALALERWGTMDLATVLRPAIGLARRGFPVTYRTYRSIAEVDGGEALPVIREPLSATYRGTTLHTMPPPSSGGILLIGLLQALEAEDVAGLGHNSAAFIHRFAEICNRYYADRAFYMGDPDFVRAPVAGLISRAYAAEVHARLDTARHTPGRAIAHGDSAWLWRAGRVPEESHETTHFCVVDRWGNAVSNTYTLNDSYGSRYVVDGTGFLLNDEMDDFSVKPGAPNLYGLVGGSANAIAPGKRMLSSMTPTIVTRDGRLFLVLGSPGGSRIITSVCQTLLNIVDHEMNVREAVAAPRVHSQWLPDEVDIEPVGFPREVVAALEARGHKVDPTYGYWSEVHAIMADAKRGLLLGAADPRAGDGTAAGY